MATLLNCNPEFCFATFCGLGSLFTKIELMAYIHIYNVITIYVEQIIVLLQENGMCSIDIVTLWFFIWLLI